jgi:hypothetical protein
MSRLVEIRRGVLKSCFTLLLLNWDERELSEQLAQTYTPDADAFCGSVVQQLELTAERHMGNSCESRLPYINSVNSRRLPASSMDGIVFLGRVTEELSSFSPFISWIGCQQCVAKGY